MPAQVNPSRSVFWRLALLVAGFCCAMIAVSDYAVNLLLQHTLRLDKPAQQVLEGYAQQAELHARATPQALTRWLGELKAQGSWATVVDNRAMPLGGEVLSEQALTRMRLARFYKTRLSPRMGDTPLVRVPLPTLKADLLVELPKALHPWRKHQIAKIVVMYVLPVLLSLLFCLLLYRLLVSPLKDLAAHTLNINMASLAALPSPALLARNDELGALGRSLKYLSERLEHSFAQQRQLLRDLSHELRTPLSRLQVATESPCDEQHLRLRMQRETAQMSELIDRTLQLAWLDSETFSLQTEPVDVGALWEMLAENALFESGWAPARLQAQIPEGCQVLGELNALAQALENILRNAIRYSPQHGVVSFRALLSKETWHLSISDEGPGVPEAKIDCLFDPFTRLDPARSQKGFGLGLAIAKRAVALQGGTLKACNLHPGLKLTISLQNV